MRRHDHGWPPRGGIILDDVADVASGAAVRQVPATSREAAPHTATEGRQCHLEAAGGHGRARGRIRAAERRARG